MIRVCCAVILLGLTLVSTQEEDNVRVETFTENVALHGCNNSCTPNDATACCMRNVAEYGLSDLEDGSTTELNYELTESTTVTICSTCNCFDSILECSKRRIVEVFSKKEWDEMKTLNVIEINLSENFLETLTQIPEISLQKLNLSNNRIELIEDCCFQNLMDLVVLDLSMNRLSEVTKKAFWGLIQPGGVIRSFDKLKHLNLAYNNMHVIPKDIFAFMHGLHILDWSGNPLKIIDQVAMGSLTELRYLRELKLSTCSLESLPEGLFRTLRKLEKLDLSNNLFSTVPDALKDATSLVFLNFDKNPITTLMNKTSISQLNSLKELHLCNTLLQSIGPSALGGLQSLEVLYICDNLKLNVIDENFLIWVDNEVEKWPTLKELYLHNNNIPTIDSHFLYRWDQLVRVTFDENPYVCDCSNQWMVDVLTPLVLATNGSAADMVCSKPQEMRGLSFGQLYETSRTLSCSQAETKMAHPGPDVTIILGVMIGIFATFPVVLIIMLLWRKGYFAKCRRKLNSETDSDEETDAF